MILNYYKQIRCGGGKWLDAGHYAVSFSAEGGDNIKDIKRYLFT